jgi:hypothetical protein
MAICLRYTGTMFVSSMLTLRILPLLVENVTKAMNFFSGTNRLMPYESSFIISRIPSIRSSRLVYDTPDCYSGSTRLNLGSVNLTVPNIILKSAISPRSDPNLLASHGQFLVSYDSTKIL